MKVVSGPASAKLGETIARSLRAELVSVFFKSFPDGESYLRFETESLKGEAVVVVQTTSPPQDQRLIQLFLLCDNAHSLGARNIDAVVPYFAYNRQDKRFMIGEVFSVETVMKLLKCCGVSRIVTVNAHSPSVLKSFGIDVDDLSAVPLLADYFRTRSLVKDAVSLSLGKKALSFAAEADSVLKGGFDYVSTKRNVETGVVSLEKKELNVKGKDVVIFDDIISSGGTMAKAVKFVKNSGARKVYAACVHPLLIRDSKENILASGAEDIVGTDCVPSSISRVSVAPLIAKALK